jgi:hypothetical protein
MASLRKEEDFIDHGLRSNLYSLHPIFFKQRESIFIQGIGTGGDAEGIDHSRKEERPNLFQISNLVISMDCCKTSAIEGNLSFPKLFLRGESVKRGFDKASNGGGREGSRSCCLLITEETALPTTQIG